MSIFERYAPFIQDFIYQNDWESLRAIQVAAGDAIFNTDENVLLSASTASGKTEAAFFPILTQFYEDPPTSVGAIYIGPLKALINDQFLRLNDLCAEAGIPVWHWHGDVSQSHKTKMLKHPSGILQITPESLEAMLLHKHAALTKLFHDLRYIVIDEVHSLMRGDRGGQTICLMERLCRMAGVNPRRIGLSATIGDLEATGAFLAAGTGRGTVIPRIESKGVRWRLSMGRISRQRQSICRNRHCRSLPPKRTLPRHTQTPASATSSSIPVGKSVWSLSIPERNARRSPRPCGSTARHATNRIGFSSTTATPSTAPSSTTTCGKCLSPDTTAGTAAGSDGAKPEENFSITQV